MSSFLTIWKSRNLLTVILFLQLIACATVFFDVPVARQAIVFLYLTFVPGIIVIKLLKFDHLDGLEIVLFSLGLSVAFLMLAGLLVNEFGFLLGLSEPLSLMPLMMILNGIIFAGGILACLRKEGVKLWESKTLGLHPSELPFIGLPVLSVVGAIYVNTFENNIILLFMLIQISLLFVVIASKKLLSPKLYAFVVLTIAISLLFHSSLISKYVIPWGSDVPVEYFLFKSAQNNGHWSSNGLYFSDVGYGRINAMLSVTVLPTIYSVFLNMDPTWVFKILFPLILSLVPLGLYQIWQTYVGRKYAFISAFLFMAQSTFYTELLGLNRQIVGELFFVLLWLVILNKKMKSSCKIMCFMIFSLALVMSHYALAEIFLFFISLTLSLLILLKHPSRNITLSMVVFFFVVMFSWYIYTSNSAVFDSFLSFGDYVYGQLNEFFNPASRGQTVLRGLGMETPPSIWNLISRAFAYVTQALIAVGFVGLIAKRTKTHLAREYVVLASIAMVFLAALILVPGLANTLNMTRFYHILLFFIAPLCIMGAETIVKSVFRSEKDRIVSILLLIVLVPYFLFQTGFVYEVTRSESWSIPLSKHRMDALQLYGFYGYMDDQSVCGALWTSKNVDVEHTQIYADPFSRNNVLTIYGMIYRGYIDGLSNTTIVAGNSTVYLGRLNVVDGVIVSGRRLWNSSELSFLFSNLNEVYNNGASEVHKNP